MIKRIIFYSWQSDLPNSTNRGFIEKALENAVKPIRDDNSLVVEPVIDRDTAGVPGAPDIASTILAKIERAQIFVCDVSIINQSKQFRPTPNPNVLIELGYAMKRLGMKQIIMVMNSSFGELELLPFDLRMRRVVTYHVNDSDEDRQSERKQLEAKLEQGIRTILTELDKSAIDEAVRPISISDQTIAAIENSQPNQIAFVRKYMDWLINEVEKVSPPLSGVPAKDIPDDLLVLAINQTEKLVGEFARVVSTIVLINNYELLSAVYKNFERILINYNLPLRYSGMSHSIRFDFYRFLGHELFVILIAILIREEKWEFINNLLNEDLYVENMSIGKFGVVTFEKISDYIEWLDYRNKRLDLRRVSLRADMLNDRHSKGELSKIVPMNQFVDTDFFLFLREEFGWRPWSANYMGEQPPRFLIKASRIKYAEQLLRPLSLKDITALRERVKECIPMLSNLYIGKNYNFHPLSDFNPNTIGSQ